MTSFIDRLFDIEVPLTRQAYDAHFSKMINFIVSIAGAETLSDIDLDGITLEEIAAASSFVDCFGGWYGGNAHSRADSALVRHALGADSLLTLLFHISVPPRTSCGELFI